MDWRPSSSVVRRPFNISSAEKLLCQAIPNLACGICSVRREEIIINFMTLGRCSSARGVEIYHNVKKNKIKLLFHPWAYVRQTEYTVLKSKGGSTKIAEFFDPEGRCEG